MPPSVRSRLLWRLAGGIAVLATAAACGSSGCQGCSTQPIPGGFPHAARFDNAMQVRVTPTALRFVESNFNTLLTKLVPGGLSFDIPPTGCTSDDQKLCCGGAKCTATATLDKVSLTPSAPHNLDLAIQARIKTNKIQYEKKVLTWFTCDVTLDSAKSDPPAVTLAANVQFSTQFMDGYKLNITRTSSEIRDFQCGDIEITGAWYCTVADWLCPLFRGSIETQLKGTIEKAVDGLLSGLPKGQEGRVDLASFLARFSPATSGQLDFLLWGGGYSEAEQGGLSLGVLGGFRAPTHNPCVPRCEGPGAKCAAPPKPTIPRSTTFRGNVRPDGKDFDVGIGVHQQSLIQAAYAVFDSGTLCLDVGTKSVEQLTSDLFGLLVPSLAALTAGKSVPMVLAVRPRQPPTVSLGKGTSHKDPTGKTVIDDPLLTITAKEFGLDIYALLEDRPVRIFTVLGDLTVPVLLTVDANGALQPVLGDLTKAFTNIQIENSELVSESPGQLAKLFPTVVSLAANFLASGFDPIKLPEVQGISLLLDEGSITSTDAQQVLSIFGKLSLLKVVTGGTTASAPAPRLETEVALEEVLLPETRAFSVAERRGTDRPPTAILRLGARRPAGAEGPVEWTYRVDGGFFRPFVQSSRLEVEDPAFWLQGRHRVEVVARLVGRPFTADLTPVAVELQIDTVAPKVALERTATGVRASGRDEVSPAAALEYSFRVGGGTFSPFGARASLEVAPGTPVEVRVRDRAGNVSQAAAPLGLVDHPAVAPGTSPEAPSSGGCAVGAPDGSQGTWWLVLLGILLLRPPLRLRRRP
ncbi:MAG: hypothetical protein IT371_12375 [Deltaproteobacteria bacterium]|nr:hypothetical protein [Deltaproteobacteria bacterium]